MPTTQPPSASPPGPCVRLPDRPRWHCRTPEPPAPIERFDINHPAVPEALDGLQILHLSDSHIGRVGRRPAHHNRMLLALESVEPDLIVQTGDFMTHPGDEEAALAALRELAGRWRCRSGAFAVPGNHDSPAFIRAARRIPALRWLDHESVEIPIDLGRGTSSLLLVGSGFPENLLASVRRGSSPSVAPAPFCIALVHYPTEIYVAAQLGLHIVLSGHTHGGQMRVHTSHAPHTSCDLPANRASGIFRLRDTLLCISRGLGSAVLPLRINCPEQAPLYTLRRRAWNSPAPTRLEPLRRW